MDKIDNNEWQVLVVEDEPDGVQIVSDMLRYHGVEVRVARNGRECLADLKRMKPALVVMDLAMPEMDGWDTLAAMRANPDTAHIPVVAITAYHSASVAEDAIQAGFDAYFAKPLDAHSFFSSIGRVMWPAPKVRTTP